jgi:exopolysaccharide biosynthesis polyprenyl glycosylphosphotransferase
MRRRQRQIRAQINKLMDGLLFALGFWFAHQARADWGWGKMEFLGGTDINQGFDEYFWLTGIIFFISPFILEIQGFYNRPAFASRRMTLWQLSKASIIMGVCLVILIFLARKNLARAILILFVSFSFVLVWIKEEVARFWIISKLGQEQVKKRLILVGAAADTSKIKEDFIQRSDGALEILAEIDLNTSPIDALVELLHTHSANGVVINASHTYFGKMEKAIQACELEGVEAWLMADFFKTQISSTMVDEIYGRPMLVFRSTPEESWQGLAKQVLDFCFALGMIVLLSPIFISAAIVISLTSPGPIFFRQQRSGLNGKPFTMLKFRSMTTNAEQRQAELAAMNEMSGPVFKLSEDPRITPVGSFLRKHSIDELPQLFNVLRGEMSLVGPRPLPVYEVQNFGEFAHRRRLSVKPGLTCLWQISGRNEITDFKDWVRLDLEYIDNWSLWLDLKILLRTVPVVLLGTGAK